MPVGILCGDPFQAGGTGRFRRSIAVSLFEGEIFGEALPGAVGDQARRRGRTHTFRASWEYRIQAFGQGAWMQSRGGGLGGL